MIVLCCNSRTWSIVFELGLLSIVFELGLLWMTVLWSIVDESLYCVVVYIVVYCLLNKNRFWTLCRVPQVLGKGAVTATQPTGSILFFAEGPVCSRQIVCRAPEKGLSAKPPLPTENLPRGLCREAL
jgi:hypothetical protein